MGNKIAIALALLLPGCVVVAPPTAPAAPPPPMATFASDLEAQGHCINAASQLDELLPWNWTKSALVEAKAA